MPSSWARGPNPRFSAPMTEVVMPDECQSMPMTAPKAWNQSGSDRRRRKPLGPSCRTTTSVIAVPSVAIRVASHGGTCPPCRGNEARPDRATIRMFSIGKRGRSSSERRGHRRCLEPDARFLSRSGVARLGLTRLLPRLRPSASARLAVAVRRGDALGLGGASLETSHR